MNRYLFTQKELEKAIRSNAPVVGLELNSIASILPYPESLDLCLSLMELIRLEGAVPGVLGIFEGHLVAGLTHDQISSTLRHYKDNKIASSDISYYVMRRLTGSPSSSAALILCRMAGIRVLCTSAFGGIHRGGLETFDISSDLKELSCSNVAVVSSGVHYIFDIPSTLEHLKTHGVPVIGYTTDIFPAFYVVDERLKVHYRIDSPGDIAELMDIKWNLGLGGGVLIANPTPKESVIDRQMMEQYVTRAILKSRDANIPRDQVTSYMIQEIDQYTQGKTQRFLPEILRSNARVSALIAKELSALYIE